MAGRVASGDDNARSAPLQPRCEAHPSRVPRTTLARGERLVRRARGASSKHESGGPSSIRRMGRSRRRVDNLASNGRVGRHSAEQSTAAPPGESGRPVPYAQQMSRDSRKPSRASAPEMTQAAASPRDGPHRPSIPVRAIHPDASAPPRLSTNSAIEMIGRELAANHGEHSARAVTMACSGSAWRQLTSRSSTAGGARPGGP